LFDSQLKFVFAGERVEAMSAAAEQRLDSAAPPAPDAVSQQLWIDVGNALDRSPTGTYGVSYHCVLLIMH
jgi:hypothetical protein